MKDTKVIESSKINKSIANIEVRQDEITILEFFSPLLLLISIYFFPIQIFYLIGLFLYGLFFIMEAYLKRVTPTCIFIFFIFLLLSFLYFIFNQRWFIFYTGSFFYFPLAMMSIVLLAMKKPFTIYYSGEQGLLSLHYTISIMWTIIYTLSAIISIILIPNPAFVYLPLSLIAIGEIGIVTMSLFYFGPLYNRKKIFNISQYTFKEVGNSSQEHEDFYSLASQEIWGAIIQSKQKVIQSLNELKETLKIADSDYRKQIVRFVAYRDDKPIGTIFCVTDGSSGLPIERDIKKNMDSLRKVGKVMEIGHFAIKSSFRIRPDIVIGLFKCAIEFALEHDIAFILNCPYEDSVDIYQKIDFVKISNEPIPDTVIGANVCVLILDLVRMVAYNKEIPDIHKHQLKPLLNQFLMERYYKRLLIRNIFKRNKEKQYNLKIEKIASEIFS